MPALSILPESPHYQAGAGAHSGCAADQRPQCRTRPETAITAHATTIPRFTALRREFSTHARVGPLSSGPQIFLQRPSTSQSLIVAANTSIRRTSNRLHTLHIRSTFFLYCRISSPLLIFALPHYTTRKNMTENNPLDITPREGFIAWASGTLNLSTISRQYFDYEIAAAFAVSSQRKLRSTITSAAISIWMPSLLVISDSHLHCQRRLRKAAATHASFALTALIGRCAKSIFLFNLRCHLLSRYSRLISRRRIDLPMQSFIVTAATATSPAPSNSTHPRTITLTTQTSPPSAPDASPFSGAARCSTRHFGHHTLSSGTSPPPRPTNATSGTSTPPPCSSTPGTPSTSPHGTSSPHPPPHRRRPLSTVHILYAVWLAIAIALIITSAKLFRAIAPSS